MCDWGFVLDGGVGFFGGGCVWKGGGGFLVGLVCGVVDCCFVGRGFVCVMLVLVFGYFGELGCMCGLFWGFGVCFFACLRGVGFFSVGGGFLSGGVFCCLGGVGLFLFGGGDRGGGGVFWSNVFWVG